MKVEIVDIYQKTGRVRPKGAVGDLWSWIPETANSISACRKRPAVLILPGGGYSRTSDREAEPVALRFVAAGFAAFVLRYSCAPNCFPVSLREAAMAMDYIRRNCNDFSVDPTMVAAVGFSAGGHLCGTLGSMYDCPEVADIAPPEQIRPDALGLCYPVAVSWGNTHRESFDHITGGDPVLRERLSLERLVRGDMPPVFLWHTRDDGSVPCRNSLILASALEEHGVDFAMHIYRHGPHGLSTADDAVYPAGQVPEISRDVPDWIETMIRFFNEIGLKVTDLEV